MSASSVAKILGEITGTPRTLMEQLLDANKKKKKQLVGNDELAGNTYTLSPNNNRISLPASKTYFNDKPERDLGCSSLGSKFSLGSNNVSDLSIRQLCRSMNETDQESFIDAKLQNLLKLKLDDITLNSTKPTENKSDNRLYVQQNMQLSKHLSYDF